MNVINAHLVGYSEATESHVISLYSIVSACSYQRIPLQNILFLIRAKRREGGGILIYNIIIIYIKLSRCIMF